MGLQNKKDDDDELLKIAQNAINSTLNQNGGAASGSGYKTEQVSQSIPSLKKTTTQDTGTAGSGYRQTIGDTGTAGSDYRQTLNQTSNQTSNQKTYSNAEMAKIMADAGGGNESDLLNQLNSSAELSAQAQSTLAQRDKDYADLVNKQADAENMNIATKAISALNSSSNTSSSKSGSKSSSSGTSSSSNTSSSGESSVRKITSSSESSQAVKNDKISYVKKQLEAAKKKGDTKKQTLLQNQLYALTGENSKITHVDTSTSKSTSKSATNSKTSSNTKASGKDAKSNQYKFGTAALLGKKNVTSDNILSSSKTTSKTSTNKTKTNSTLTTASGAFKNAETTAKANTLVSKAESGKLTKTEKKEAKKVVKEYATKIRSGESLSDEDMANYTTLQNATSLGASFMGGLVSSFTTTNNIAEKVGNAIGKLTGNENAGTEAIASLKKQNDVTKNQNKVANVAGNFAGKAAQYSAFNTVADAAGATEALESVINSGLGTQGLKTASSALANTAENAVATSAQNEMKKRLASKMSNILIGQTADTAFDTIPTIVENQKNGKYSSDNTIENAKNIVRDVASNQLQNFTMNVVAEALPSILDAVKGSDSDKAVRESVQDAIKNTTEIKERTNVADAVTDAVKKTGLTYQSPEAAEQETKELLTTALANQNASTGLTYQSPAEASEEAANLISQFRQNQSIADRLASNVARDTTEEVIPNINNDTMSAVPSVRPTADKVATARRNGVQKTFSAPTSTTEETAEIPSIISKAKNTATKTNTADSVEKTIEEKIAEARVRYGIPDDVRLDQDDLFDLEELQQNYGVSDADAGQQFMFEYGLKGYYDSKATPPKNGNVFDQSIPVVDETGAKATKKPKTVASSKDNGNLTLDVEPNKVDEFGGDLNDEIEAAANLPKQPKKKSTQAMSEVRQDKDEAFAKSMEGLNSTSAAGKSSDDLWNEMTSGAESEHAVPDYTTYKETPEQVNNRARGYRNSENQQTTTQTGNPVPTAANAQNTSKTATTASNNGELTGLDELSERMHNRKTTTDEEGYIGRGYTNSLHNSNTATEEQYIKGLDEQTRHYTVSEKESFLTAENAYKSDPDAAISKYSAKLDRKSLREWSGVDIDGAFITWGRLNQLSKEAADAGDSTLAETYRIQAAQVARNYTDAQHYNGQALQASAKHSGTFQGAMMSADGAVQKMVEKELNPKGVEQLDQASTEIKNLLLKAIENNENLDGKWREVKQIIDKYNNLKGKVTDVQIEKLTDGLLKNRNWDAMQSLLGGEITGYRNVSQEALDKASELFEQAQAYNYNSKSYMDLEDKAYQTIVSDIVSGSDWKGKGFMQKGDAYRYLMMLCNPRTMVKNEVGNKTFGALTEVKDEIAGLIEDGVDLYSKSHGGDGIARTKTAAIPSKELRKAAKEYGLDNAARDLKGSKYTNPATKIDQMMPTFSNKGVSKGINWLSKKTSDILENADESAMMNKYSWSLARYIKANGYDASVFKDSTKTSFLEQASEYAVDQAQRAAFHQDSGLAKELTRICTNLKNGNAAEKVVGVAIDATVPFKKTPINVLKSALEYSPANMVNVLTGMQKLSKCNSAMKKTEVTKLIDNIAKTATGSALLIGGALAANEGWIRVSQGDGKQEQKTNSQTGNQSSALYIGDARFSLSDLSPSAYALVMGASMEEAMDGGEDSLTSFIQGISSCADSLVDTTMLSGISNILTSLKYADDDEQPLGVIAKGITKNYAGQFLPSFGRALNSTINDTTTSTYSDKSGIRGELEQEGKYLETKIPGLQNLGEAASDANIPILKNLKLEPSIDRWGNEVKNNDAGVSKNSVVGDNSIVQMAGRAFSNMATPVQVTSDTSTDLDNKIRELKETVTSSGAMSSDDADKLFPYTASSEATISGEKMSPSDWTEYQKQKGQTSKELAEALLTSGDYDNLDDTTKAEVLTDLYTFSKAYTQSKFGATASKSNQKLIEAYESGGASALIDSITSSSEKSDFNSQVAASNTDGTSNINNVVDYLNAVKAEDPTQAAELAEQASEYQKGTYSIENGQYVYKNGTTTKTGTGTSATIPSLSAGTTSKTTSSTSTGASTTSSTTSGATSSGNKYDMTAYKKAHAGESANSTVSKSGKDYSESTTFQKVHGLSDSIPGLKTNGEGFETAKTQIDTDGNGRMKKSEITSWIETMASQNGWDQQTKHDVFAAFAASNVKNPY